MAQQYTQKAKQKHRREEPEAEHSQCPVPRFEPGEDEVAQKADEVLAEHAAA